MVVNPQDVIGQQQLSDVDLSYTGIAVRITKNDFANALSFAAQHRLLTNSCNCMCGAVCHLEPRGHDRNYVDELMWRCDDYRNCKKILYSELIIFREIASAFEQNYSAVEGLGG